MSFSVKFIIFYVNNVNSIDILTKDNLDLCSFANRNLIKAEETLIKNLWQHNQYQPKD